MSGNLTDVQVKEEPMNQAIEQPMEPMAQPIRNQENETAVVKQEPVEEEEVAAPEQQRHSVVIVPLKIQRNAAGPAPVAEEEGGAAAQGLLAVKLEPLDTIEEAAGPAPAPKGQKAVPVEPVRRGASKNLREPKIEPVEEQAANGGAAPALVPEQVEQEAVGMARREPAGRPGQEPRMLHEPKTEPMDDMEGPVNGPVVRGPSDNEEAAAAPIPTPENSETAPVTLPEPVDVEELGNLREPRMEPMEIDQVMADHDNEQEAAPEQEEMAVEADPLEVRVHQNFELDAPLPMQMPEDPQPAAQPNAGNLVLQQQGRRRPGRPPHADPTAPRNAPPSRESLPRPGKRSREMAKAECEVKMAEWKEKKRANKLKRAKEGPKQVRWPCVECPKSAKNGSRECLYCLQWTQTCCITGDTFKNTEDVLLCSNCEPLL